MERVLAERGRYPAVQVMKSVSRTMPRSVPVGYRPMITEAKRLMSTYADMEDLIRLGAYRRGSNPDVDRAIQLNPGFEAFLNQQKDDSSLLEEGYRRLAQILATPDS
eukprot:gene39314-47830_t